MSAAADIAAEARRRIRLARALDRLATQMRAELDGEWETGDGTAVDVAVRLMAELIERAPFKKDVGRG